LPTTSAQAASFDLPPVKVKTVAIVDKPAEKGASVTPQEDRIATSSVTVAVRERTVLHKADPRWARDSASSGGSSTQQEAVVAAYADDEAGSVDGSVSSQSVDGQNDPFAMIVAPDENTEPTVELAGTVPHLPEPAPRDKPAREPSDEARPAPKAAVTGRALTGSTTINEAANMRAAARSGSSVLMVVPDGARVSIAPGCEQWCEISYNGRRGFVYKDFVGGGRVASKPRTNTQTVSAEPLDKAIYSDSNFITSGKQTSRPDQDVGEAKPNADAKPASTAFKTPAADPSMR
jgi:uncharacterized protein YraI